jgi:Holliday junction resolvase RusA-like endonuclease
MTLTFTVPWNALVSDNRKYVTGYILSTEYRKAKALIGLLAAAEAKKAKWPRQEGRIRLEVVVREPDRRKRDLNYQKAFLDGITAAETIWWDDSQVRQSCWAFDDTSPRDKTKAGATVTILALDEPGK